MSSYEGYEDLNDSSQVDDLSHFEPDLYHGSDHSSDDDMVTPPIHNSDGEEDEIFTVHFSQTSRKID